MVLEGRVNVHSSMCSAGTLQTGAWHRILCFLRFMKTVAQSMNDLGGSYR